MLCLKSWQHVSIEHRLLTHHENSFPQINLVCHWQRQRRRQGQWQRQQVNIEMHHKMFDPPEQFRSSGQLRWAARYRQWRATCWAWAAGVWCRTRWRRRDWARCPPRSRDSQVADVPPQTLPGWTGRSWNCSSAASLHVRNTSWTCPAWKEDIRGWISGCQMTCLHHRPISWWLSLCPHSWSCSHSLDLCLCTPALSRCSSPKIALVSNWNLSFKIFTTWRHSSYSLSLGLWLPVSWAKWANMVASVFLQIASDLSSFPR